MELSVSAWLKQKRLDAGLDLGQLAKLAGTNSAQISRIETGKSELSLHFLVLLVWALEIEPDELVSTFSLPPLIKRQLTFDGLALTFQGCVQSHKALRFVSRFSDNLSDAIRFIEKNLRPAVVKANSPILSPDGLLERVQDAISQGEFLPLPPALSLEQLYVYYVNEAIITMADSGANLRLRRHNSGLSLEELAKKSLSNRTTIHRIENNRNERIPFELAVNLDRALNAEGQVFSMFWAASQLQAGILYNHEEKKWEKHPWDEKAYNLVDTYIKLARWAQLYDNPELPWREEITQPVKNDNQDVNLDRLDQLINQFGAPQVVNGRNISELTSQIELLIPGDYDMMGEEKAKKIAHPEMQLGVRTWDEIKLHIGDDPFAQRAIQLYKKHFMDNDYHSLFRVVIRELLISDAVFFQKILGLLEEQQKMTNARREARRKAVLADISKKISGNKKE